MRYFQLLCVSALSSSLLACGGGGSGGTSGTTTVTPNPMTQTLQTNPTANYAQDSVQRTVFSLINAQRSQCHFGTLNQHVALDLAATNHAKYLVFNGFSTAHDEVAGQPLFTGLTPQAQALSAGYSANPDAFSAQLVTVSDLIPNSDAAQLAAWKTSQAEQSVRSLLSAPYHLSGMMVGARELGIAQVLSTDVPNAPANRLAFNLFLASATGAGIQQAPDTQVSSYPCAGVTGTQTGLFNENPNPIPNASGSSSLSAGQPVLIHAPVGQVLTISDYVMTNANDVAVTAALLTHANPQHNPSGFPADANAQLASNEAVILPLAPLTANTTYHVVVNGTRKAGTASPVAFQLDFRFTTGSGNASPTL
ncbi:MAG: hypothetical protein RL180_50 [Pseudomonadota bacterium]|jgi:hypothetical protein